MKTITVKDRSDVYVLLDGEFYCTHDRAYIIPSTPDDFNILDELFCPNMYCDGNFTDQDFERTYYRSYHPKNRPFEDEEDDGDYDEHDVYFE